MRHSNKKHEMREEAANFVNALKGVQSYLNSEQDIRDFIEFALEEASSLHEPPRPKTVAAANQPEQGPTLNVADSIFVNASFSVSNYQSPVERVLIHHHGPLAVGHDEGRFILRVCYANGGMSRTNFHSSFAEAVRNALSFRYHTIKQQMPTHDPYEMEKLVFASNNIHLNDGVRGVLNLGKSLCLVENGVPVDNAQPLNFKVVEI